MLLLLAGDIQTGKTRWLQKAVERLEDAGISCHGVLAPGIWEEKDDGTFEKKGIDNLLLPEHTLIPFARRTDIAMQEGAFDPDSQAGRAQFKWHISDEAIAEVNNHFRTLRETAGDSTQKRRILIIDELGRLEVLRGEGLVEAMSLLSDGPRGIYTHAIVIARDMFDISKRVADQYGSAWGGSERIAPNDEAWGRWLQPLVEDDR